MLGMSLCDQSSSWEFATIAGAADNLRLNHVHRKYYQKFLSYHYCSVRRIWAYEISVFVRRTCDVARPGSGSAWSNQDLLRLVYLCLGYLGTLIRYHFRSMLGIASTLAD